MSEADKYITELDSVIVPVGTESIPIQQVAGGEGTTYKISIDNLASYIYEDAPEDGEPYVRVDGEWVLLTTYLGSPYI